MGSLEQAVRAERRNSGRYILENLVIRVCGGYVFDSEAMMVDDIIYPIPGVLPRAMSLCPSRGGYY